MVSLCGAGDVSDAVLGRNVPAQESQRTKVVRRATLDDGRIAHARFRVEVTETVEVAGILAIRLTAPELFAFELRDVAQAEVAAGRLPHRAAVVRAPQSAGDCRVGLAGHGGAPELAVARTI